MSHVISDLEKIIEEKEQKMCSKLHLTGTCVFDIYRLASRLDEKFPKQINFNPHAGLGFTFKGSNFSCYVERDLPEFILIKYEGDYQFTFKEKLQEDGTYKVQVCDIDDIVTADIIQNCIVKVYNELIELQKRVETRIKSIEEALENA